MRDTVRRIRVTMATSDHTARSQFDDAAFESVVRAVVAQEFPTSVSRAVTLVRTVRLDLGTVQSADHGRLAAEIGHRIGGRLRQVPMDRGTGNVICFPSVAEYLARFVEQYVTGCAVDVWYFRPLHRHIAATLYATLKNLARAEPEFWRDAVRLLHERGVLQPLAHTTEQTMSLATTTDESAELSADQGWPLFLLAWRIVSAWSGARDTGDTRQAREAPVTPDAGVDRGTPQAAFARYLSTSPPGLIAWDPESLGQHVARIVDFLCNDTVQSTSDFARARAIISTIGGVAPQPVLAVLRRHVAPSDRRPVSWKEPEGVQSEPPTRPRLELNRTRALRVLDAVRAWQASAPVSSFGPVPIPKTENDSFEDALVLDTVVRALGLATTANARDQLLAPLRRPDILAAVANTARPADSVSARLAILSSHLHDAEREQLIETLLSRARHVALPEARTFTANDSFDDALVLDAIVRKLRLATTEKARDELLAPLRRPDVLAAVPDAAGPAVSAFAHLATLSSHLHDAERELLIEALVSRARHVAPAEPRTVAAGLFYLIRPLLDLRLHGIAARAGADIQGLRSIMRAFATQIVEDQSDPAIDVFATGGLRPARMTSTLSSKCVGAVMAAVTERAHLLDIPDSTEATQARIRTAEQLGAALVPVSCRLFTRWLRGFQRSSVPFTIREFILRRGSLRCLEGEVVIDCPSHGMDIVLDLVGYRDPIETVPWWTGTGLSWTR